MHKCSGDKHNFAKYEIFHLSAKHYLAFTYHSRKKRQQRVALTQEKKLYTQYFLRTEY